MISESQLREFLGANARVLRTLGALCAHHDVAHALAGLAMQSSEVSALLDEVMAAGRAHTTLAQALFVRRSGAWAWRQTPEGDDMTVPTITEDPDDPRLRYGREEDAGPVKQNDAYLVLPEATRAVQRQRPVREAYRHLVCGAVTSMPRAIAETYAAVPTFYQLTYCATCRRHLPVGIAGEFVWLDDGGKVGA